MMRLIHFTFTQGTVNYRRRYGLAEDELQDVRLTLGDMFNRGRLQAVTMDETAGPADCEGYKEAREMLGVLDEYRGAFA